jgi:hypothetical protein
MIEIDMKENKAIAQEYKKLLRIGYQTLLMGTKNNSGRKHDVYSRST